jgi:endonuclease/exonuclease/phosphatase family protein
MARALLRSVVVAVCLVGAALVFTGSAATRPQVTLLQLNLCASGRAGCFTGRSVPQAAVVLRDVAPDVVTLNEICASDLPPLADALADAHGGEVVSAFEAAPDRPSGGPTRCVNGQEYGIGMLARAPAGGYSWFRGAYPVQDPNDPEERVWLCLAADLYACTTHLAGFNPAAALGQCRHLLGTTVPGLVTREGARPAVVAGDLNLRFGAAPDLRSCLPPGWSRVGDGGLQHVVSTGAVEVRQRAPVDLARTTDHQGVLVSLALTGRP